MTLSGVGDIQQGHIHTLNAPSRDDQGIPTIPPTLDANQQDDLQPVDTTATKSPPPPRHSQPKLTPGMGRIISIQQQHHQLPVIKPTLQPHHLDTIAHPTDHPLMVFPTQAIVDDIFFNIPATQAVDPIFDLVENTTTAIDTCVDDGKNNTTTGTVGGDQALQQQQPQQLGRMETALAPIPEDTSLLQSKSTCNDDADDDAEEEDVQHEKGAGRTTTKENQAAAPAVVGEASHSKARQLATATTNRKDCITAAQSKKERELLLAAREADKLFCLDQKAATPMTDARPSQLSPMPSGWLFSGPSTAGTALGSTLGEDDCNETEDEDVNNSLNICPTLEGDDAVALAELRKFYIDMRDGTGPEQGAMGMLMISHSDVPKSVVFEVLTGMEDADSSMPEAYKRWWARIIWREVRKIGLGPFTFKDDTYDKGKGKKGEKGEEGEEEAGNANDIEEVDIDVDLYLAGANEVAEREKDLSRLGFLLCSPSMDPAAAAAQQMQQQQQQQSEPAAACHLTVAPHLEDNAHALDLSALMSQRINPLSQLLPLQQQQQQRQRDPECDGVSQLSLGLMPSMPPPVSKEPTHAGVAAAAAPNPEVQAVREEEANIETGHLVPPTQENNNQPGDDDGDGPQQSYPLEVLMSADRRAMENTPTMLTTSIPSGNQPLSPMVLLQSGQDEEVPRGRVEGDRGVVIPETQHPEAEENDGDEGEEEGEERNASRPLPTMCSAPNHYHHHPVEQLSTLPSLLEQTETGEDEEEEEEEDHCQLQPSIHPGNDLYSISGGDNDESQKQPSQGHAARKRMNAMKMIEDIANTFPPSQEDPPAAAMMMARPMLVGNLLFKKRNTAINNKSTTLNALKQVQPEGSGRSRLNNAGDVAMVVEKEAGKAGDDGGVVDGSLDLVAVISDGPPVAVDNDAIQEHEVKEKDQQYNNKETEAKKAQAKGKMPAEEKSSKLQENLPKMKKNPQPVQMKKRGSDVSPDLTLKRMGRVTRLMSQKSQRTTRSQNNKRSSGNGGGEATRGSGGMKKKSKPTVARAKAPRDVQRRELGCGMYQKRPPYKDDTATATAITNAEAGGSKSNVQQRVLARKLSAPEVGGHKDQDAKGKPVTTRPEPAAEQSVAEETTPKKAAKTTTTAAAVSAAEDAATTSPAVGRLSRISKDIALHIRPWMAIKGAAANKQTRNIQKSSDALFGSVQRAADKKSPRKHPNKQRATTTTGLSLHDDYVSSNNAKGISFRKRKQNNKNRRNKQPTTAMVDNPQEGKDPASVAVAAVAKVGQKRRMSAATSAAQAPPPEAEAEVNEEDEQPPVSPQQDKRKKTDTKVVDSPDLQVLNQKGRHQIIATQQATQATQNTKDRTTIEHIEKKDGAGAAEAARKASSAAAAVSAAETRQRRSLPTRIDTGVGSDAQMKTISDLVGLRSGKRRMSVPAAVTAAAMQKKKGEERALSPVAEDNHQQRQEHGGKQQVVGAAAGSRKRKANMALPPLVQPPPRQQQSGSATTTLNRSTTPTTRNQHKAFSGFAFLLTSIDGESAKHNKTACSKMITDLGGTVLDDIPKFGDRLINRFDRFTLIAGEDLKTLKVLYAHALGIDILSPSWLERCHSKNTWCVPRGKSSNSEGRNTRRYRATKSPSAGTSDFMYEKPHGKKPFKGVAVHSYPRKADVENVLKFAGAVIVEDVECSDVFFFLKEEKGYKENEARRIGKNGKKAGSVELVEGKEGVKKALESGDFPPEVIAALRTKKEKGDGDEGEDAQQEGGTSAAALAPAPAPQQLINNNNNNGQHNRQNITTSPSEFGHQSLSSTYSSPKALPSQQHQSEPGNGTAGVGAAGESNQPMTVGGIQWLGASKASLPDGNGIIRTCYEGFLLPTPLPSAAAVTTTTTTDNNNNNNRALQPQPVRIGDYFEVSVLGNFKQIKQVVKLWTDEIGDQDLPHMVTRKIYRAWDVGLHMFQDDALLECEETETNVGMGDIGTIVRVLDREDTARRISFYYDHGKNMLMGRRYGANGN